MSNETENLLSPIQRSKPRWWRWILFLVALVATLAALFYAVENWRGRRAWTKFQETWRSKGALFDPAAILPRAVPPDQNFAATPFLAALLDYEYRGNSRVIQTAHWRDSEALTNAQAISIEFARNSTNPAPRFANGPGWKTTDLPAWQSFYRNDPEGRDQLIGDPATDILQALSRYDPVIEELRSVAQRPHSIFPVHYQESLYALIPHLSVLRNLNQVVALRAVALLDKGEEEKALAEVRLGIRLVDSIKEEPILISQIIRLAMIRISLQPVWEGMVKNKWSDNSLRQLQAELPKIVVLAQYPRALEGERVNSGLVFDRLRDGSLVFFPGFMEPAQNGILKDGLPKLIPDGWYYQNQVLFNRLLLELGPKLLDAEAAAVFPNHAIKESDIKEFLPRGPYGFAVAMLFPDLTGAAANFARAETYLQAAITACALDRYRLAHGSYPRDLQSLLPDYLNRLPKDLVTGSPLKFVAQGTNGYLLYSVGWNQKDDGGVEGKFSARARAGDWVWPVKR